VPTIIKYITHKLLIGWGPNNVSLINFSINFDVDTTITVKDFVDQTFNWDLTFLFGNRPSNIVNKIIALPTLYETDDPDVFGWGGTSTHNFSVNSAYDSITENIAGVEGNWKALWKWTKDPHQIQTLYGWWPMVAF
jgi:hypothetical protein